MPLTESSARAAGEGTWEWDLATGRFRFSARWLALLGCQEHDVGNTREAWLGRVHADDAPVVTRALDARLAGGPAEFEIPHRLLHADGSYRWMRCHGVVHRDSVGRAVRVTGSYSDVTASMGTDARTGLPNHLLLVEHLTRAVDRARRYAGFHFAVLILELGRPPGVAAGQPLVDPLPAAAARRLETCVRSAESPRSLRHDDLVARWRDDRFAILLCGLKDLAHATVAADRVLATMLAPFTVREGEVCLPVSIGIAMSATGYAGADEALRDAEIALHRATVLGGGRYEVFDTAALQLARTELQLEAEFAGALERGEFTLFYQPVVSLTSTRIVGFEALLRWQHPVLGLIAPLDFIPLAERTGFIVPLGQWVLAEACGQLAAWRTGGSADGVWVSVNVSTPQFHDPTFADRLGATLEAVGLPPRDLVLEVTESLAIDNRSDATGQLFRLRTLGVRISVDDFGTGHSSLASLRRLPVDALKMDRTFVRGIEGKPDMVEIFATVLTMARQLGLAVVAEGVENEAQLAVVRRLGCECVQGYLFSKPVDAQRAVSLLHDGLATTASGGSRRPAAPPAGRSPVPRRGRGFNRAVYFRAAAALILMVVAGVTAGVIDRAGTVPEGGPPDANRAVVALPPAATTFQRPTGPPSESTPTAAGPRTASLRVEHQHRIGACTGRLVVSRDTIAYVPEDRARPDSDGFRFVRGEFLHDFSDNGLTIRSNTRTYRFKVAAGSGSDDGEVPFRKLIAAMTRAR